MSRPGMSCRNSLQAAHVIDMHLPTPKHLHVRNQLIIYDHSIVPPRASTQCDNAQPHDQVPCLSYLMTRVEVTYFSQCCNKSKNVVQIPSCADMQKLGRRGITYYLQMCVQHCAKLDCRLHSDNVETNRCHWTHWKKPAQCTTS